MHQSTICSVYESKLAWINFDGITCTSCKMFLYRNENYDFNKNKYRFNTIYHIIHSKKEPIYPLDLLEIDRLKLTTNQWTYLSNIINTDDTQCPIKDIQKFINTQLTYRVKMRMHLVSTNYISFIGSCYRRLAQVIEGIFHLNILSKYDRVILIERTMPSLDGSNGLFIVRELNLHNNYEYTSCTITTYGQTFAQKVAYNANQMDNDRTLIQFLLIILSFSTDYDGIHSQLDVLLNTIEIFFIQNIYV